LREVTSTSNKTPSNSNMARKKQSTFEDVIDLASILPWWGGLSLAIDKIQIV
jgi:hypothetical protein